MNTIKKFSLIVLLTLPVISFGQKVNVSKGKERIKGNNIEGYTTDLQGTKDEVSDSFTKYLKGFGKIKSTGNSMQLAESEINGAKNTAPLYAVIHPKGEKIAVWIGLNASEWATPELAEKVLNDLEKVVYDFGVKFYRDKIQVDVDEALRAQQATEKQTQRLINENKNLTSRLEFNQKEKLRLEKALVENKLEYELLLLNLATNRKSQDSVTVATDQIKKMVEVHKERQRKVN